MEFTFGVQVDLKLQHQGLDKTSKLKEATVYMNDAPQMGLRNLAGDPNAMGVKAISQALISGLVNNVIYASNQGIMNADQHVKTIMEDILKQIQARHKMQVSPAPDERNKPSDN